MNTEDDRLAAQAALFDAAMETPVTTSAIDFLWRSHLLVKIADDDLDAARSVIHTAAGSEAARREWDQLSHDEQVEVASAAGQHWNLNLNLAVRKMFHAANVLGFQGDTLDPKHVAIVAATYLSRSPDDVIADLSEVAK